SLNPTNSFKARGQSAAITRAKYLGAKTIALPTAGNAGNAASAYSAAAGLACEVFIPKDAKRPFIDECKLYGANVTLVDGLITDAGRMAAETGAPLGWYDVSTLKEPYRIEGKKTMAYELAEQLQRRAWHRRSGCSSSSGRCCRSSRPARHHGSAPASWRGAPSRPSADPTCRSRTAARRARRTTAAAARAV